MFDTGLQYFGLLFFVLAHVPSMLVLYFLGLKFQTRIPRLGQRVSMGALIGILIFAFIPTTSTQTLALMSFPAVGAWALGLFFRPGFVGILGLVFYGALNYGALFLIDLGSKEPGSGGLVYVLQFVYIQTILIGIAHFVMSIEQIGLRKKI